MIRNSSLFNVEEYVDSLVNKPIELLYARRFNQDSDFWIFDRHSHPYIEFIYFLEGAANVSSKNKPFSVSAFDMVVHPSNVEHKELLNVKLRQEVICIGLSIDTDYMLNNSFVLQDVDASFRWICNEIYKQSLLVAQERTVDTLCQLLIQYMRNDIAASVQSDALMSNSALLYIHEHFREKLCIEDLAALNRVSNSYFSRAFHKVVGTTPMKYINALRINEATHLLETGKTIEEIAVEVGFNDPKYFSKVFKKSTGLSPSGYKNLVLVSYED